MSAPLQERNFHLLMGGLFLSSLLLDPAMRSALPSWDPPAVTFITLAIGMLWMGRFVAWRTEWAKDELRALRRRVDELEDWQRRESAASRANSRGSAIDPGRR